jgi:DNA-binding NtrC family response regulator
VELLIVDDDNEFRATLVRRFVRRGFNVFDAASAAEALEAGERRQFDVAIFDLVMPGVGGMELLKQFSKSHTECEVIMLTGQGSIETAVEAMKQGAYDYLTKPFPLNEMESLIEKAYDRHQLRKENVQLRSLLARGNVEHDMIGDSPAMQEVFRIIERAGPSEKSILIQGESGTGKELVARALHRHSPRVDKPLVVINCAALTETLLESELFGHEKGSFTGAISAKQGLFEIADGGTLLIDEIGEMPGSLQAKLLRVLEDGSMRRVGSLKERRVDVRILVATNRRMDVEVAEGRFREDLFYRINVMSLDLPPLRERNGDVRLLVDRFLGPDWQISDRALQVLERFYWPGNVRQLMNVIERAKIMADGNTIQLSDLPHELIEAPAVRQTPAGMSHDDLASIEKEKIIELLQRESGNKTRAAKALGIDRRKLYRLLEKYDISPNDVFSHADETTGRR